MQEIEGQYATTGSSSPSLCQCKVWTLVGERFPTPTVFSCRSIVLGVSNTVVQSTGLRVRGNVLKGECLDC